LLSSLRVGDGLEYIKGKAAKGNKDAQAELDNLVFPENLVIWDAYQFLRGSISDTGQLPIAEVVAYCEIAGITNPPQRMRVLSGVMAMHRAYRQWSAPNKPS
jgi:hypothetical protein